MFNDGSPSTEIRGRSPEAKGQSSEKKRIKRYGVTKLVYCVEGMKFAYGMCSIMKAQWERISCRKRRSGHGLYAGRVNVNEVVGKPIATPQCMLIEVTADC